MKICVWPNTSLGQIPAHTDELHLARPIAQKKLARILKTRSIARITLSKSTFIRLPKKTLLWLESNEVPVFIEHNPGKPLQTPMLKILDVVERIKDHQSLRQIEKITGIPKSTAHYLIKYAKRGKTKKGKNAVYLTQY